MDTTETKDRFSMLLIHKSSFLKTALDADYEAYYVHVDDRRLYSLSRTTRIQEVANSALRFSARCRRAKARASFGSSSASLAMPNVTVVSMSNSRRSD
jgi:hypothetical protein